MAIASCDSVVIAIFLIMALLGHGDRDDVLMKADVDVSTTGEVKRKRKGTRARANRDGPVVLPGTPRRSARGDHGDDEHVNVHGAHLMDIVASSTATSGDNLQREDEHAVARKDSLAAALGQAVRRDGHVETSGGLAAASSGHEAPRQDGGNPGARKASLTATGGGEAHRDGKQATAGPFPTAFVESGGNQTYREDEGWKVTEGTIATTRKRWGTCHDWCVQCSASQGGGGGRKIKVKRNKAKWSTTAKVGAVVAGMVTLINPVGLIGALGVGIYHFARSDCPEVDFEIAPTPGAEANHLPTARFSFTTLLEYGNKTSEMQQNQLEACENKIGKELSNPAAEDDVKKCFKYDWLCGKEGFMVLESYLLSCF